MNAINITSNTVSTILFILVFLAVGQFGKSLFVRQNNPAVTRLVIVIVVLIAILGIFGYIIFGIQGRQGILYFVLTTLGSVGKWIWDAIKDSKMENPPNLNFYALVPALIFAPIVYGAIIANLVSPESTPDQVPSASAQFAPYILAFQNGFFWQTVYDQITK